MRFVPRAAFAGVAAMVFGTEAFGADLPEGFVYLRDVDGSIHQDIRYAGSHNFVGRPVEGYQAPECVLTTKTAKALRKVQARLAAYRLSLVVFDCYRPVRAVKDFQAWARDPGDTKTKAEFYPEIDKSRLFARGYIAGQSSHSRGNAVDLALLRAGSVDSALGAEASSKPCHLSAAERSKEITLDFGTGYDCFHELSYTRNPKIRGEARTNRQRLVREMNSAGFKNYHKEWWHFTLPGAGLAEGFDFPILSRSRGKRMTVAAPDNGALGRPEEIGGTGLACGEEGGEPLDAILVCAPPSDIVARDAPVENGGVVFRFSRDDEQIVACSACQGGKHGLAAYWKLDLETRGSESAPWCLMKFFVSGALSRFGWIRAEFLAPAGTRAAWRCPAR